MLIKDGQRKEAILRAIADRLSRMIIDETIPEAKSAAKILESTTLPRASVYRRIHELIEGGLLIVERSVLTSDGKKYDLFRSRFKVIKAEMKKGVLEIQVSQNISPEEGVRRYFSLDSSD